MLRQIIRKSGSELAHVAGDSMKAEEIVQDAFVVTYRA